MCIFLWHIVVFTFLGGNRILYYYRECLYGYYATECVFINMEQQSVYFVMRQ